MVEVQVLQFVTPLVGLQEVQTPELAKYPSTQAEAVIGSAIVHPVAFLSIH